MSASDVQYLQRVMPHALASTIATVLAEVARQDAVPPDVENLNGDDQPWAILDDVTELRAGDESCGAFDIQLKPLTYEQWRWVAALAIREARALRESGSV